MPIELYYKTGFGRRLRKISAAAAASLSKINQALFTSIGVAVVAAPTVTTAPSIAGGDTVVGTVFTVTPGVYTGSPTVTRQWKADGADIAGQTGTTFDSTGRSVGEVITCVETATNAGGSVNGTSNGITLT